MKIFGYTIKKENKYIKEADLLAENIKLKDDIEELSVGKYLIFPDVGDPSPIDEKERKKYVGKISVFYRDIFKDKIKQMISNCYKEMEDSRNGRDYDYAMKGAIYSFRELDRWFIKLSGEHLENNN